MNRRLTGRNTIVCFQGMGTGLRDSNSEVHDPIGVKLIGGETPTMDRRHLIGLLERITGNIAGSQNPSLLREIPGGTYEVIGRVGT